MLFPHTLINVRSVCFGNQFRIIRVILLEDDSEAYCIIRHAECQRFVMQAGMVGERHIPFQPEYSIKTGKKRLSR